MKLKLRMFLLVGSACLLYLLSIGVYFLILSPVDTMQAEVLLYQEVDRAAANLQVSVNRLVVDYLAPGKTNYAAALERWALALKALDGVTMLKQASADLAAAVEGVRKLGGMTLDGQAPLVDAFDQLLKQAVAAGANPESSTWSRLSHLADLGQVKDPLILSSYLGNVVFRVGKANTSLDVMRTLIRKNDALIGEGMAHIRQLSTVTGLIGIVVALLFALVVSWLVARNLASSMRRISSLVETVAGGDLRVRYGGQTKDELGELGRNVDTLLDSLNGAFRRIQAASFENLKVKDTLAQSVSEATSSAVEIEANSVSILGQLQKVDERIQSSEADLSRVVQLLNAFGARMEAQNGGVADASSAVAELVRAIAKVSDLSEQNRRGVETLSGASEEGRELFLNSFAKVAEIDESVADIQEMVLTIAEIASQTNILALNAAIEAAHAGEAGKGFAVVADEISKLAAASAESSRQIADTIKAIVAKIREASATRAATLGAFEAIGVQVASVRDQSRGIDREASAMNGGTDRIREVMATLTETSTETVREAARINSVVGTLGEALGQVGRISHEVVSNIGEITQGLGEIARTVSEVSVQADKLGGIGDALDQAVNAFQTDGGEAVSA